MGISQDTFFALSIALVFVALLMLGYVLWHLRTRPNQRDDIASMMFLLQTMRDLLEQQKALARDFNKAFDTRIETIKRSVDSARADLTSVRESITTAMADVEKIRQTSSEAPQRTPVPEQPSNVTAFVPAPQSLAEPPKEVERPVLRVLAMPRDPEPAGDIIDAWVGLDFAGDEPDPLGCDVPDIQPQAPHDADAARHAFRALLDMGSETVQEEPIFSTDQVQRTNGNGRPVPPVHARVYEYSDAGMNIAQIAQELGIGKGEVRLILSLRKNKDA